MTMNATPRKLRDGTWGVQTRGIPSIGDTVTVRTRAGKTWETTVADIVWSGDTEAICRTRKGSASRSTESRPRNNGRCSEQGCSNSSTKNAPHCQASGGLCGYCAYDEF